MIKEIVSNNFNLNINKINEIPPEQLENLEYALKDYNVKLENIRKAIQIANEKISKNVFDLKTSDDILNKLTDNGQKEGLLDGCVLRTSPNGQGQHIYVEHDTCSIKDGANTKAMFGFKSPTTGENSNIPFLAIGHDGVGGSNKYLSGVSYPATYNPIGANYAYAEWVYQFVEDNYSSLRFTENGEIELNPDYRLSIGKCHQTGERKELASVFEKNDNGCVGTYLVEAVDVHAENFRSKNTLSLESNNGEIGVVLYGGSEKALQPKDSLSRQIQLGTPWGAWKSIFTANTYSNTGIVVDNVRVASKEEITLDNAIDSIEFISAARTTNTELQMNVTKLLDTNFVETSDKTEDVFINESELLKLAILEIKKLKNEIKDLKIKIYGE